MIYRRLATASTLVPLAFGLLGLAGWLSDRPRLASLHTDFIPMAPGTAVAFVLVSAALMTIAFAHGTAMRRTVRVAACLVFLFAFAELVDFFVGVRLFEWEAVLGLRAGMFGAVPLARMSPLTSTTLALVGVALACLTSVGTPALRDSAGVLGTIALFTGTTVVLGYAYGAPLLYGGSVIPMALTTGLASMGTGVALVALAGPTSLPLRPFSGGAIRAARAEGERQRAEKALRDSERLAQSLVEHLPQRIFVKDRNSNYLFCNSNYARDLGIEQHQILGKDDFAFFPRELAEAYRADDRTVMADGTLRVVDERYEGGGKIQWVNTTKVPYRDEHGEIIGVLGIFEDITERKRAEEQIRRHAELSALAEREFRGLFEANPLPMWIYDLTTLRFLEVNEAAVGHYGYERDDFLAMTIKDIRPLEDVERLLTHLGQSRGTWQAAGNWRHRLKSGEIIDVDITSHTITFAGRPAALVVSQDITERKRSIEALRTAEERTRFALQSAGVGIWDMDYATGVLRWSEILESQYGLQAGTSAGTFEAFVERIHPDDRAPVLETLGKAMKGGTDFSIQNRSIWPDGTVRWLSGAGRIVLGEHGQPVRGVGVSLDVTELRTLEAQFQQAQKMEAVGRLAGGIAHDFNNLLTSILGYCELLLPDFQDPHRADLEEIYNAATRAAGLTRQLLAFSRKQIIAPAVLDLNAVVSDIRPMLGRLIGEDVKIVLGLESELARMKADRGQIEQIVMNLAVNARDAMPRGGTLTIATANVELDDDYAATHVGVTSGSYVALTVTDTGTGMTSQVQARLFEPFFTTKDVGKGTGLGLATVHGIVRQNGGSVGVYSEVGIGTSFHVYFPRAEGATMRAETVSPAAPGRTVAETVLVVDDAEELRGLARRLLLRHGYAVLVAGNADEALRLFEEHPAIDVLLTDVVMPGSSGPELTRQLRTRRPGLKVIYMSGYTEDAIVEHGVIQPGIAFIHKPFTSDTLGRTLREVLDR